MSPNLNLLLLKKNSGWHLKRNEYIKSIFPSSIFSIFIYVFSPQQIFIEPPLYPRYWDICLMFIIEKTRLRQKLPDFMGINHFPRLTLPVLGVDCAP